MIFGLTSAAMPSRSSSVRTYCPLLPSPEVAMNLALSRERFSASALLYAGFGEALRNGDADAGPAEHDAGVGGDLALLDQALDVERQDDRVDRLAGVELLQELGRQAEVSDELVPGGAFELRRELFVGAARRAGAEHADVGGLRGNACREGHRSRKQRRGGRTDSSCAPHSIFNTDG